MLAAPPLFQIVFASPPKGSPRKMHPNLCTYPRKWKNLSAKVSFNGRANRKGYKFTSDPQTYHMVVVKFLCPRSLCTAKRLCVAL